MLKAIIVDDEQHCIDRLERLLRSSAHDIQMIAYCKTIDEAKKEIAKIAPDILFLMYNWEMRLVLTFFHNWTI